MVVLKTSSTFRSAKRPLSFPPLSDSAQKMPGVLEDPLDRYALHKLGKRSQNRRGKLLWFRQHLLGLYVKRMLPVARKDVLPTTQKSFPIYEYNCLCNSGYVGRTSQRLQDRIKQLVSQWLRQLLTRPHRSQPHRSCKRNDTKPDCDSAIGQHLSEND